MSLLSELGKRPDPVRAHNFVVSLVDSTSELASIGPLQAVAVLDVAVGGFSECSGLEMSMTPEEYKEGGRNSSPLQFPNRHCEELA